MTLDQETIALKNLRDELDFLKNTHSCTGLAKIWWHIRCIVFSIRVFVNDIRMRPARRSFYRRMEKQAGEGNRKAIIILQDLDQLRAQRKDIVKTTLWPWGKE